MHRKSFKRNVHRAWAGPTKTLAHDHEQAQALREKLDHSKKGTHPEIRSKLDPHLIEVVRTSHSHLLDDVHNDILGGIIEDGIGSGRRSLQLVNAGAKAMGSKGRKAPRTRILMHTQIGCSKLRVS